VEQLALVEKRLGSFLCWCWCFNFNHVRHISCLEFCFFNRILINFSETRQNLTKSNIVNMNRVIFFNYWFFNYFYWSLLFYVDWSKLLRLFCMLWRLPTFLVLFSIHCHMVIFPFLLQSIFQVSYLLLRSNNTFLAWAMTTMWIH